MTQYAQNYAQQLANADNGLHHSGGPYGENLNWVWSSDPNFKIDVYKSVDDWYAEGFLYNYNQPGFSAQTGHFTQVVWVSSQLLGVGVAQSASNEWFVVAVYSPAGNYVNPGQFQSNVLPLSG